MLGMFKLMSTVSVGPAVAQEMLRYACVRIIDLVLSVHVSTTPALT